ncbi:SMP-30/gluconolactonase/LRE family protein [Nocardioides ginsengisoli]|uniref:SMP-30/gluconolactonase/LRE family protein n=1 Tax=Nocardioides ginsengisoli TaxID=363868 RepID=A0ABW3VX00_9ACTN
MDILLTGLGLVESPRWHEGRLWFSDWTHGRIIAVDHAGDAETVVEHASLPLCFDFLGDGRLVLASNPSRALLVAAADGSLSPYADLSGLAPTSATLALNEVVAAPRGRLYVNGSHASGFVALVTPDGARVVAEDLAFPNGMAITADGDTLLVADSHRNEIVAFTIEPDGTLSGRRTWAALGSDNPDGISVDPSGAVWYADVPHQHCVLVAEGGDVLRTVPLDRGGFSCAVGDGALYVVTARWPGMEQLATFRDWDGQVLRFDLG